MTTLAKVKKEAAKHGADLIINRECGEAEAWLPDGNTWMASSAKCIVVSFGYTGAGVMPKVYSLLIEDMLEGVTA
jgi:hypothetical protein